MKKIVICTLISTVLMPKTSLATNAEEHLAQLEAQGKYRRLSDTTKAAHQAEDRAMFIQEQARKAAQQTAHTAEIRNFQEQAQMAAQQQAHVAEVRNVQAQARYAAQQEAHTKEIRKLKKELSLEQNKVEHLFTSVQTLQHQQTQLNENLTTSKVQKELLEKMYAEANQSVNQNGILINAYKEQLERIVPQYTQGLQNYQNAHSILITTQRELSVAQQNVRLKEEELKRLRKTMN